MTMERSHKNSVNDMQGTMHKKLIKTLDFIFELDLSVYINS